MWLCAHWNVKIEIHLSKCYLHENCISCISKTVHVYFLFRPYSLVKLLAEIMQLSFKNFVLFRFPHAANRANAVTFVCSKKCDYLNIENINIQKTQLSIDSLQFIGTMMKHESSLKTLLHDLGALFLSRSFSHSQGKFCFPIRFIPNMCNQFFCLAQSMWIEKITIACGL